MGLISDIKIDGNLVKGAFEGFGGFLTTIREVLTGEASPEKKLAALQKVDELEQQIKLGQMEINKIEAASSSVLVAGWRPYIGWICGTSLGVYYIPQALIAAIMWMIQCVMVMRSAVDITVAVLPAYPNTFDVSEIIGLVVSMLGFGGLRTYEKTRNGK